MHGAKFFSDDSAAVGALSGTEIRADDAEKRR